MRMVWKETNSVTDFYLEKKDVNWSWKKALTKDRRRGLYHTDKKNMVEKKVFPQHIVIYGTNKGEEPWRETLDGIKIF